MQWIDDHILALPGWAAIAIVFLLPALESSVFLGFVFPGETAVVLGGVLAYNHRVALAAVLAAAIAGAIIGDSIGYGVGKRWGDSLLRRLPERFVKPDHIDRGKRMIVRLGGRAVFVGRFVAALRALVPGLCGVSLLPYHTFLVWNAAGGIVWATGFTMLGYLAGNAWHQLESTASNAAWGLFGGIVVLGIAILLWRHLRERRSRRMAAPEVVPGQPRLDGAHRAAEPGAGTDTAQAPGDLPPAPTGHGRGEPIGSGSSEPR